MHDQEPTERQAAITEIATKILSVASEAYARAPKVILTADQPNPPPLDWHVAYTAAQFTENLFRLMTLRKMQVNALTKRLHEAGLSAGLPDKFSSTVTKTDGEVRRQLEFFGIRLKMPI